MPSVGNLFATLGLNSAKFTAGINSAKASLNRFDKAIKRQDKVLKKFSRRMQKTGQSMTRSMTLPIVLLAGAATKMAIDFDTSMTKIETLVGIASDKVKEFRKDVLKLAGETGRAPRELADALFVVTSAGLRGAAALETLDRAARASASGLGETKEIARATTAVIQAYGEANMSAARATDILLATVRAGNLEAADLAPVLGRVIGIASQLGVSFEEVGANIATFTRLGVSSEEAVTGLRGIMNALLKPTREAKEALKGVRLTFDGLRKSIKEKGLTATLLDLTKKFKGNETGLAKVIPNVRALSNVLGTAGAQGEAYAEILDTITNSQGFLDAAFKRTAQTPAFRLKQAFANLKKAAIEIGDVLIPFVTKLADRASNLIKAFTGLNKGTKKIIIGIALLAATIGPLLIVGAKMVNMFIEVRKVIIALNIAMVSNPYLAAAVAIALVVTALIAFSRKSKEAAKSQDELTDAQRTFRGEAAKEKSTMDALFKIIKDTNVSTDVRKQAINKLNEEYKDYLPSLLTEKTTLEDIEKIQKKANDALIKSIAIRSRQQEIIDANTKSIEESKKIFEDFGIAGVANAGLLQQELRKLAEEQKKFGDELEKTDTDGASEKLLTLGVSMGKINSLADTFGVSVGNITGAVDALSNQSTLAEKSVNSIKSFYDGLIDSFEKGKEVIEDSNPDPDPQGVAKKSIDLIKSKIIDVSAELKKFFSKKEPLIIPIKFVNIDDKDLTGPANELAAKFKAVGEAIDAASQIGAGFFAIFSQGFKNQEMQLDNFHKTELFRINEKFDLEKENMERRLKGAKGLSDSLQSIEEKRNKAIQGLESDTEAKRRDLMRKKAKAAKASAIFEAVINTAVAVTSAIALGGVAGIILAGIVGALGAVQIGLIAAEPLPALKEGGIVTKDTVLRAGEAGPEAIIPLKKLNQTTNLTGEFRIKGTDLVLLLERVKKNKGHIGGF